MRTNGNPTYQGLGRLQREILETLEQAKKDQRHYHGKGNWWDKEIGGVYCRGRNVILAEDIYDLRGTMKYLARKLGKFSHCSYVSPCFEASFSRAIRGLIQKGYLTKQDYLLPDGSFFTGYRQIRFVTKKKAEIRETEEIHNA